MSLHGKSAISSQNNPLVSVLPYPDIVWNARSRKFKKQEIQTMVACKMSNIFCPQTRNYFKKLVLSKCNFFFLEERQKAQWMTLLLNCTAFPPCLYFCYNYNGSTGHDTHDNTDPNFSVDAWWCIQETLEQCCWDEGLIRKAGSLYGDSFLWSKILH